MLLKAYLSIVRREEEAYTSRCPFEQNLYLTGKDTIAVKTPYSFVEVV